nr:unnamed protein product [Digitaria exilis]
MTQTSATARDAESFAAWMTSPPAASILSKAAALATQILQSTGNQESTPLTTQHIGLSSRISFSVSARRRISSSSRSVPLRVSSSLAT